MLWGFLLVFVGRKFGSICFVNEGVHVLTPSFQSMTVVHGSPRGRM